MELKNILVGNCFESESNPRGKDFEDKEFAELKKSIGEKGVLVPILVRGKLKKGQKDPVGYEVIAGNRRFRAAKQLGIKEIPAKVVEMTDEEAREAQIIENLQRKDIHPLEEGSAYRAMVVKGESAKDIASKIGKSETYIRYRLHLTNLIPEAQKVFREGKISDSIAVLISDLVESGQKKVLKNLKWNDYTGNAKSVKDYIATEIYEPLKNQPWLKSPEAIEAVGKCIECPPNRQSLFGDFKDGACVDIRCYNRKMKNYIEWKKKEWKEKGVDLIPIVKSWYSSRKDVLDHNRYSTVGKKCGHETKGIVVEGEDTGEILTICIDQKCPEHGKVHSSAIIKMTPEEKAARKKAAEKEKEDKKKEDEKLLKSISRAVPLTEKSVGAFLEAAIYVLRDDEVKNIAERHGWDPLIVKEKNYMDEKKPRMVKDWEKTVREKTKTMTIDEKMRIVFEILLERTWDEPRAKIMKML
jgi:ParB family chromosome partitioning protein